MTGWFGPGGLTESVFRAAFDTMSDLVTLTKADGTILENFPLDWHAEQFSAVGEIVERVGDILTDQWGELLRADGHSVADFPRRTGGRADFGTVELSGRTFTIRGVTGTTSHIRLHCDEGKDT